MAVKPIPDGYHTITPYLVCERLSELIDFLKTAFGAIEIERHLSKSGRVMHAEIKLGDSIVMMGESMEGFPPVQTSLYFYVKDTDLVYYNAIKAGGVSLIKPANQFYGDRNAGVQDPSGNKWWIATHVEDVSAEEMERRSRDK
ncbi:MAG: VOC family protein [Ignavibacteriaceae bacterium]